VERSTSTESNAAYGFRWAGLADEALAVGDADEWPTVRVEQKLTSCPGWSEIERVDADSASIQTLAARLRLDRLSSSLEIHAREDLPVTDVIHPTLWPAASVFARWHERETFHAGAISFDGQRAWAVLGERGAGKSSLLAAFALHGVEVLADDLLVVAGQRCFAGPRCLDLREEAATALGIAANTRLVRSTERRRLGLRPCAGEYALRGFIHLRWGAQTRLERLLPVERLPLLLDHRRIAGLGADFEHLLDLVALPSLRLTRPRDWRTPRRLAAELERALAQLERGPARRSRAKVPASQALIGEGC
jgi:hypothetical protein